VLLLRYVLLLCCAAYGLFTTDPSRLQQSNTLAYCIALKAEGRVQLLFM
jgi:hypothetical protein